MAEFNRVNTNGTRADVVNNMIKSVKNVANESPMHDYVDNTQPLITYWYHIDQERSYSGKGHNDTAGPYDGGIKYILIKDYVVLGAFEERAVDVEKGEHLDARWKLEDMTFLHKPGTLKPLVGDRFSLQIEDHKYLYKVHTSVPVNFNNKPYIRTIVSKCEIKNSDYYAENFKADNLLTQILEYSPEAASGNGPGVGIGNTGLPGLSPTGVGGTGDPNITPGLGNNGGTKAAPFFKEGHGESLGKLKQFKAEFLEEYNAYFYDEGKNMYMTPDPVLPGALHYTPLLVDLQMEFRPLWTYGINTILTHETIVHRRSKFSYRKHIIRNFLLRKPNAWTQMKKEIIFSGYVYLQHYYAPTYKVESYLNDSKKYFIWDYFTGVDTIYDNQGEAIASMTLENNLKIPDKYHLLFEKYSTDSIEIDWFVEWLEEFEIDFTFADMVCTFLVLCIIDAMLYKFSRMGSVSL